MAFVTNGFPPTVAGAAAGLGRTPHGIPFSPSLRMDHRERPKQGVAGCQSAVTDRSPRRRVQKLYLAPKRSVRASTTRLSRPSRARSRIRPGASVHDAQLRPTGLRLTRTISSVERACSGEQMAFDVLAERGGVDNS